MKADIKAADDAFDDAIAAIPGDATLSEAAAAYRTTRSAPVSRCRIAFCATKFPLHTQPVTVLPPGKGR